MKTAQMIKQKYFSH